MKQISKQTCNKYEVLKPNQKICQNKRLFYKKREQDKYQIAHLRNGTIRKYLVFVTSNVDKFIQIAQWRYDTNAPIVKVQFIEILPPQKKHTQHEKIRLQIYVEHLEIQLQYMGKLILPQAIYLLIQCLFGFQILFRKFGKLKVQESAIGLNSQGKCLVWLNKYLQSAIYQLSDGFFDEKQIIEQIIKIVKAHSYPICFSFLTKMTSLFCDFSFTFEKMHYYIQSFVIAHKIKVPVNLKYLVHENRFKENMREIVNQKLHPNKLSPNKFGSYKQNINTSKKNRTSLQAATLNVFTDKNIICNKQNGLIHQFFRSKIFTIHSDKKQSSNYTNSRNNSLKFDSIKQFINKSRIKRASQSGNNTSKDISYIYIKKQFHTRSKSQSYKHFKIVNMLNKKKNNNETIRLTQNKKAILPLTEHNFKFIKNTDSYIEGQTFTNSYKKYKSERKSIKMSITINDLFEPDKQIKHTHKSSIINQQNTKRIMESLQFKNEYQFYQNSSLQNYKLVQKCPLNMVFPLQSAEPTFKVIPFEDQIQLNILNQEGILMANLWTKTINNLFNEQQFVELNTSVTEGCEVNNYLSDVKLEKLQQISKHLTVSLIPKQQ